MTCRSYPPTSRQRGPGAGAAGGPTAAASASPSSSPVLAQVSLDASASTGTGTLTYAWSLYGPAGQRNDLLSSATAVAPTFTPDVPGGWTAVVVVTDDDGNDEASAYVVSEGHAKPGSPFSAPAAYLSGGKGGNDSPPIYETTNASVV